MDRKGEQPDHAGLQPVSAYDAPEVVPDSRTRAPLHRYSSVHSPEVLTPKDEKRQHDYYGSQPERPEVRAYYGDNAVQPGDAEKEVDQQSRQRTICGLRRKVFFWVLAVVVILIIIAAVVGGVVGSNSSSKSQPSSSGSQSPTGPPNSTPSSGSPPAIESNTGLAVIKPKGSSTLYQYYQDAQGRIVENQFTDGAWSIQGNSVPGDAVIATDAQGGSPIAATSWTSSGVLFRAIFYLDENGRVMSTNRTDTTDWTTPINILTDDSAAPGTIALAVCSGTDTGGLNGLRVYYASSSGVVQEVGINFGDSFWSMWAQFDDADTQSGVATVLAGNVNHLYYVRDSSQVLMQQTWEYAYNDDGATWEISKAQEPRDSNDAKLIAPDLHANTNIATGSDITAVYDGVSTDHIFYQDDQNQLVRALYYGQGINDALALVTVAESTKLSATYDFSDSDNGATIFFQPGNDTKAMEYQTINRSGQEIQSGTVE